MTPSAVLAGEALFAVLEGDCITLDLPLESIDAVVSDPPAGIGFMGKDWDHHKGGRDEWIAWMTARMRVAFRLLKPGGHAVIWALPRTSHWTATAIEDAGFEIRDVLTHHFGSGFPKSARVNRDPRFCQCAEPGRSGENTAREQQPGGRTCTEADAPCGGLPPGDVRRSSGGAQGSPAGCPMGRDSHDAQLPPGEGGDLVSPPSQRCVRAHTHSPAPGDAPEIGSGCSPSRALHICHPSNLGLPTQSADLAGGPLCTRWNTQHPQDQKDSCTESPGIGTQSRGGSPSASLCLACGKPDANGIGTALKPAVERWILAQKPEAGSEDWILARKPLIGTVAANVLAHGTGGINVGGCRVGTSKEVPASVSRARGTSLAGSVDGSMRNQDGTEGGFDPTLGRWPANLLLTHSEGCNGVCMPDCPVGELDRQSGDRPGMSGGGKHKAGYGGGMFGGVDSTDTARADSGGASRFFPAFRYVPKAPRAMREAGLVAAEGERANDHPTVKHDDLMRWLVRLVTPPGGVVLDMFTGSGSTGRAALLEGCRFIGIDAEAHYVEIAKARIKDVEPKPERQLTIFDLLAS